MPCVASEVWLKAMTRGFGGGGAERGDVDDSADDLGYGVTDQADRDAAKAVADQHHRAVPTHTLHHVDDMGNVVFQRGSQTSATGAANAAMSCVSRT